MTRADFIREVRNDGCLVDDEIAEQCVRAGFLRPSRQAIESALAKSGTRGRPSSRDKCPTCGQRVDSREKIRHSPGCVAELDPPHGRCSCGADLSNPHPAYLDTMAKHGLSLEDLKARAVATMSQKPRTKRTRRTPKAPRSKRKAK